MAEGQRLSAETSTLGPHLLMAAPFPPPVTGQTVSSQALALRLEASMSVTRLNIVRGDGPKSAGSYLVRALRVAHAALVLATGPKARAAAYISVDANRGMIITALLAACARVGSRRLFLHHHSFEHVSARTRLMAAVARIAGPTAIHIVICDSMGDQLKYVYPSIKKTVSLSNIFLVEPPETPKATPKHTADLVTLGYMSKVTREKGAYTALDTLAALGRAGVGAKLRIGGTFDTVHDEADFKARVAELELTDRVEFLGFIGPEGKADFFQSIDYFLFPSTYRNETQGIVNLEALSWGVPVIAIAQCCIASDLDDSGGLVVADPGAYVSSAAMFVGSAKAHGLRPRDRYVKLREDSKLQLADLVSLMMQSRHL